MCIREYGIICGTSAKQPRLDTYFAPSVTSSLPAARQEACTQKLISFIWKDMRPISVVDGIGFREFCEALEPRYHIPCCRSFKPLCAESATVRERQREGERKSACVRECASSAVLAISSFTYFCVGNMLLNMFKLK